MVLPVSSSTSSSFMSSSFKRSRLVSRTLSEALSQAHPSLVTTLGTSVLLNLVLLCAVLLLLADRSTTTTTTTPASEQQALWNIHVQNTSISTTTSCLHSTHLHWNGGHPQAPQSGSCYCGDHDHYCLCTPNLAIDLIIAQGDTVWCVRRKDTNQWATMGGFVLVGETLEETVRRELKEETGLELPTTTTTTTSSWQPLQFLGIYADPRRDNRRHTASAVYVVHFPTTTPLHPVAADDVKQVQQLSLKDIEQVDFFADHQTILLDYRRWYYYNSQQEQGKQYPSSNTKQVQSQSLLSLSSPSASDTTTTPFQRSLCWTVPPQNNI